MVGLYAEPLPQGFGFSDTAFRVFILMASRRLKSDRFFTRDYRPEVYTPAGLDWIDDDAWRRAAAPLSRAGAGAAGRRECLRAVDAGVGVRELAPGVHMLGAKKGGRVRAYLIETNGELSLVDTLFENDGRGVLDAIRRLGRKPSDLKRIVLTHAHRSHLGGLAALKRETGAAVLAHEWEADIISGDRPAQSVGLKPTAPFRTIRSRSGSSSTGRSTGRSRSTRASATATRSARCRCSTCRDTLRPSRVLLGRARAAALRGRDRHLAALRAGWPAFTLNAESTPCRSGASPSWTRQSSASATASRSRTAPPTRCTGSSPRRRIEPWRRRRSRTCSTRTWRGFYDWLTRAFGFTEKLRFAGDDGTVNHARWR